jgi:hypothetical protein
MRASRAILLRYDAKSLAGEEAIVNAAQRSANYADAGGDLAASAR